MSERKTEGIVGGLPRFHARAPHRGMDPRPQLRPTPPPAQPHAWRKLRDLQEGIEHPDPGICANVIVGLIKVTCYLLDQQLRRLELDFLKQGGLRERMTRARSAAPTKTDAW